MHFPSNNMWEIHTTHNSLRDEAMDVITIIATYNTAVTDAASEILGNECHRKMPWVRAEEQNNREANKRIQNAVKKAKEDWICTQCTEIETSLNKSNSNRAYQLEKDLTSEKQGRSSTVQGRSGKCVTEEQEILSRWTENCS